jgi:predicted O-methyltransferase YrrM
MAALDADGDGELSAQEIAGAVLALKKLDRNSDGRLSREELRPQFGGPGGPGGFGPGGRGMPGGFGLGGPGGPGRDQGAPSPAFENEPRPKDDGERKILQGIEQISQEQGRRMNVPAPDGRLLRVLAETISANQVVEFGTSNGISAIWLSLALRKTDGKLITHEIDPDASALARKNFAAVGVADIVTVVEGNGHEKAKELKGPIDLVFIDADKEGYLDYLNKTLPLVRAGGLIAAHNMTPRMASTDFGKAITTNPDLETVFYTEGAGVSVTLKKR